jgi:UDP-N-acetylmuramoylalanine--D-glutamate ligase
MQDEDLKLDDQVLQPDAESGAMQTQAPFADLQSISDGNMSEMIQEQAQEAPEMQRLSSSPRRWMPSRCPISPP